MPEFLSPELEQRLRATLLRCGPFASDRALRAVFVDARIAAWRDDIPDNTPSRGKRVAFLIDALMEQSAASGDNALVLFLRVLADRASPGDACHNQLAQLAAALEGALPATGASSSPSGASTSGKYNIHIHGGQVGNIGDSAHIEGGINFGGKKDS